MIGLFAIGLIALWVWLTWLLSKGGRRFIRSEFANRTVRVVLVIAVAVAWSGASFWYIGGRKIYYDAQVRGLCASDGGIKVYETVTLPAGNFDKWGNVHIPARNKAKSGDKYYFELKTTYLRKASPELWRSHYKVVRASDGKVLGESVRYARRGGDLPGPWHPSSYGCPERDSQPSLYKSIFDKESGE